MVGIPEVPCSVSDLPCSPCAMSFSPLEVPCSVYYYYRPMRRCSKYRNPTFHYSKCTLLLLILCTIGYSLIFQSAYSTYYTAAYSFICRAYYNRWDSADRKYSINRIVIQQYGPKARYTLAVEHIRQLNSVTDGRTNRITITRFVSAWVSGLFVPLHFRSRERKVHRENFRSRGT